MRKKLNCIMLIDDDEDDIYYHELIISRMDVTESIVFAKNGLEALEYLRKENQVIPELIFLDINMPRMNGWEFLEQYKMLDPKQKARITIVMLTTSVNPADLKRAQELGDVDGYENKPLTEEMLTRLLDKHFQDYL